jgi:hypothetical protein
MPHPPLAPVGELWPALGARPNEAAAAEQTKEAEAPG